MSTGIRRKKLTRMTILTSLWRTHCVNELETQLNKFRAQREETRNCLPVEVTSEGHGGSLSLLFSNRYCCWIVGHINVDRLHPNCRRRLSLLSDWLILFDHLTPCARLAQSQQLIFLIMKESFPSRLLAISNVFLDDTTRVVMVCGSMMSRCVSGTPKATDDLIR